MNTALTSHTEDLLVKYLDGTLSTAEQQDFETLLTTTPEFAEEVRALTTFDEFLDTAPLATRWSSRVDTTFLSGMQQQIAQVVASGAATTLAGSAVASGIVSKSATATGAMATKSIIAASLWIKTLIVAALLGTVGVGVWKYRTSTEPQAPAIIATQQASQEANNSTQSVSETSLQQQQNTPKDAAQLKSNAIPSSEALPKESAPNLIEARPETTPAAIQANTPLPDQEAQSNVSIERDNDKLRETIEQLTQNLRNYEQSGDNANAAIITKRLGMVARQVGHFEESNAYLAKALKGAQNLKLKELEGEIRAEQAVLYRATGNTEQAVSALRDAIKILSEVSSSSLTKWTKELERWEKK